jgi:DNA mismatch repair protein MutS
MNIDQTTFHDIGIFHTDETQSIFHRLDCTHTLIGRYWLERYFTAPFSTLDQIQSVQQIIRIMGAMRSDWPVQISNGTIMVLEKFYESPIDTIPADVGLIQALTYKWLHAPDYALVRYSVQHFADFVQGMSQLSSKLMQHDLPTHAREYAERITRLLQHPIIQSLLKVDVKQPLGVRDTLYYGYYLRYSFKSACQDLIDLFGRFDAWSSMAQAEEKFGLTQPLLLDSTQPVLEASGLHHLLLRAPVSYQIQLDRSANFLFLTGANMAGKSTFIKSIGAAVYLAHIGMAVPASQMRLSLFDGILSNITVTDNIVQGESYFFNEVQRIRNTIEKINDGRKWLVLIDELFKGTNVQDAMKCSSTVIQGLLKLRGSLFVLSTHLYEIADELKTYPNIIFRYFETEVRADQLLFSYQLREGVSQDRLGYLILKREKVVELLEKL